MKAEDYDTAAAIAYVADRAAYRFGLSRALLKTVDEILLKSPQTPVAPQVVIRKARIMKDDGDLHGAMKVLDAVLTKRNSHFEMCKYECVSVCVCVYV